MLECEHCHQPVSSDATACSSCGAPISSETDAALLAERVRALMAKGEKIEAIRVVREATGVGLAEAKHLVESTDLNAMGSIPRSPEEIDLELADLLRAGQKIEAIKRHREVTHAGLKESKDYVEALARRNGIQVKSAGCMGLLVLMLAVMGAAAAIVAYPHQAEAKTHGRSQ